MVLCMLMKDVSSIVSVNDLASLLYQYIRGVSTFQYSVKDI